ARHARTQAHRRRSPPRPAWPAATPGLRPIPGSGSQACTRRRLWIAAGNDTTSPARRKACRSDPAAEEQSMSATPDLALRFARLATPTIANALDDVEFEGVLSGLAQMVPGTRCVGRAVTVREITGRRGDFASEDFKVGKIIDAAAPGDVIVIDNGGHRVS